MQARRTQSLLCPHVPWPASKHNDNLVQQALNRDGHLSHSRWWKRCAATAQTERRGPSCLAHTPSEIQPIISLPDSPSRWSLTPAVIPTHCFFSFFPSVSVSLFWRAHRFPLLSQTHPRCSLDRVQIGEGRAGLGQDWGPLPAETEKEQTVPLLPCAATPASLILHMYTHTYIHTHTHIHTPAIKL